MSEERDADRLRGKKHKQTDEIVDLGKGREKKR